MAGKISSRTAKDLLAASVEDPEKDPEDIATEKGLFQVTDVASIGKVVEELVRTHEDVVNDFRGGKTAALQFLVGQGMKALKGAVDPTALRGLIEEEIAKS
jgi:aspartyl-tRNA(Asn)/glutamyl-tRNA(Gln) amidotransferase subunit B